jgi:hypothetical protein
LIVGHVAAITRPPVSRGPHKKKYKLGFKFDEPLVKNLYRGDSNALSLPKISQNRGAQTPLAWHG